MHQSIVELSLNVKNGIIFSDRREEKIIQFFAFKVDSTIDWCILFYTLLTGNLRLLYFNGLLTVRAVRSSTQFSDISAHGTLAVDVALALISLAFPFSIVPLRTPLLSVYSMEFLNFPLAVVA